MAEHAYDARDVRELVLAARAAVEELYIVTRLGTRRAEPARRLERLTSALAPFASVEDTPAAH